MKTMVNPRLRALIEAAELWVKRAAGKTRLKLVHVEFPQANAFIVQHHRHHGRIPWHRFSLALQLPFLKVSESMGNLDSKIVDAGSVD